MQKPTINRHQSVENRLFDSAGKYSTLETNAVGNTLNGSPSNLQNLKPSKSNARFKKLDPEHVIGGMQNPSPERNEIFKVKDAIRSLHVIKSKCVCTVKPLFLREQ